MKKILFTLTTVLATSSFYYSQDINSYEKVFYKDVKEEADDYTLSMKNIVDVGTEIKFAFSIENTSGGYLLFNPDETEFRTESKEYEVKEKTKLIAPGKKKTPTINIPKTGKKVGEIGYSVKEKALTLIKKKASIKDIPEFKLPIAKRTFSFDGGECSVDLKKKSTASTKISIDVTNTGDDWLWVEPSNISVKMPDEETYINAKNKDAFILAPGDSKTIKAEWERMPKGRLNDMQKVSMFVQFDDVFRKTSSTYVGDVDLGTSWDDAKTMGK